MQDINDYHNLLTRLDSKLSWLSYQQAKDFMPTTLLPWLTHRDSFMERLKQFGAETLSVNVLNQQWQKPFASECDKLKLHPAQNALIREVAIQSPNHIWMVARTLFPRSSLTGKNKQLAHLKTKSLGSALFSDPTLIRTEFEFINLEDSLWARRSVFYVNQKPLLLSEIFLPSMTELC